MAVDHSRVVVSAVYQGYSDAVQWGPSDRAESLSDLCPSVELHEAGPPVCPAADKGAAADQVDPEDRTHSREYNSSLAPAGLDRACCTVRMAARAAAPARPGEGPAVAAAVHTWAHLQASHDVGAGSYPQSGFADHGQRRWEGPAEALAGSEGETAEDQQKMARSAVAAPSRY